MDFINRSVAPRYKGAPPAAAAGNAGLLAGFWRVLAGGGGQPAYRQRDGATSAPGEARAWWQPGGGTPAYKAAPPAPAVSIVDAQVCACAEADASAPSESDDDSDQVRSEIYIW